MGSVKTGKSELGAQAHTRYHSPRSDLLHNRTHVAMTGCSNVLPLLSCAILLSCLGFSAAAGAAFTAEVDGVNVTVDNEVCEVAAWRVSSWQLFCLVLGTL